MRVEAVLFDLFDTLLLIGDEEVYYPSCLKKLYDSLVENGVQVSFEDFSRVYFEIREKLYTESYKSLEEPHFNVRISQTLQKLGYNYDASNVVVAGATRAFSEEFMRYVRLDEDAIYVLQKLRRKYKLGVVSNFAIPECAWELLEKSGLKGFFDVVLISGEVNRRKPSPEIFEKALKALDVDASKAVFVGDTPSFDVKGPKSVGIKAVLLKKRPVEKIMDVKPDKTINSLKELLDVLEDC